MKKIFVIGFLLIFTSFVQASKPLDENNFKKSVKEFCEHSSQNTNTLTTPVTGKTFASPIFFKINKIEIENKRIWTRKTKLDICAPSSENTINSKNAEYAPLSKEASSHQIVGEILLHESPKNTNPDGIFSLHFIEIKEGNKGKGYGSSALDLTIMLAQHLAKHTNFYSTLKLQCSDYDGDKYLGDVPFRLSYYADHGFRLTSPTLSFMNHIDLQYFINSFDEETFKNFLESHMNDFCVSSIGKKIINDKKLLNNLLNKAKLYAGSLDALKDDEKLQIAESDSSKVAQFILDRVFYDSNITEKTQNKSGEWIYAMFLNVKKWEKALEERKSLLQIRKMTPQRKYNLSESEGFKNFIKEKALKLLPLESCNKNNIKSITDNNSKKRNSEGNKPKIFPQKKAKGIIYN